jgi:hypothetical protein
MLERQIKELNARMRAMAEEKRALEKDKNRLERMVQAEAIQPSRPVDAAPPSQVCSARQTDMQNRWHLVPLSISQPVRVLKNSMQNIGHVVKQKRTTCQGR